MSPLRVRVCMPASIHERRMQGLVQALCKEPSRCLGCRPNTVAPYAIAVAAAVAATHTAGCRPNTVEACSIAVAAAVAATVAAAVATAGCRQHAISPHTITVATAIATAGATSAAAAPTFPISAAASLVHATGC